MWEVGVCIWGIEITICMYAHRPAPDHTLAPAHNHLRYYISPQYMPYTLLSGPNDSFEHPHGEGYVIANPGGRFACVFGVSKSGEVGVPT